MNRDEASTQIKDACRVIARELMRLNPAIRDLTDKPTEDALYEAVYELTKQGEIVKKKVIKLENRDDSTEL